MCLGMAVPLLVRVCRERGDLQLWGDWFRLCTYIITTCAVLLSLPLSFLSPLWLSVLSSSIEALLCIPIVYNVLFGLRTPQIRICDELEALCMESMGCKVIPIQYSSPIETWEACLYSFSLCGLLVLLPVLVSLQLQPVFPSDNNPSDHSITTPTSDSHQDNSTLERSTRNLIAADSSRPDQTSFRKEDFNVVRSQRGPALSRKQPVVRYRP